MPLELDFELFGLRYSLILVGAVSKPIPCILGLTGFAICCRQTNYHWLGNRFGPKCWLLTAPRGAECKWMEVVIQAQPSAGPQAANHVLLHPTMGVM